MRWLRAKNAAAARVDPEGIALGRRLAGEAVLPSAEDGVLVWPFEAITRHALVLGASGMGKTETSFRIAHELARKTDAQIFYLDGKGNRQMASKFGALMADAGRSTRVFPNERFAAWRGDWNAVMNRLLEVVAFAEIGPAAYYRDIAKLTIQLACRQPEGPPRSSEELCRRLDFEALARAHGGDSRLQSLSPTKIREVRGRYEAFFASLGSALDGEWSWEDTEAGYFLLDPLALRENAGGAARLLFGDFGHYFSQRKDPERPCVLFIDEFSSIARGGDMASVVEQARSFNVGLVLVPQSLSGMGGEEQRDRILDSVETVIAHACQRPAEVAQLGGERDVVEISHRYDGEIRRREGYARQERRAKVEPQQVRSLPIGTAWVMRRGRAAKIAIDRAPAVGPFQLPEAESLHRPVSDLQASAPKELSYLDALE